jgi:hypothetical protein
VKLVAFVQDDPSELGRNAPGQGPALIVGGRLLGIVLDVVFPPLSKGQEVGAEAVRDRK